MTLSEKTAVEVLPTTGFVGAEITGVDLRRPLDEPEVAAIRQALLRWKVVFFREQDIDHAQHVAFARRFGTPSVTTVVQPRRGPQVDGYPEIFPILYEYGPKDEEATPSESTWWHHDGTAYVNPPLGAVLRAETAHPHGGDTGFANMVAAYEGLPRSLRDLADGLRAVHRLHRRGLKDSQTNRDIAAHPRSAIHPVVRVHPETGERALYVNRVFTEAIVGVSQEQSRLILDLLFEETEKPEYAVPFRWEPGSIAFWDNRAALHRGPNDLRRLGHKKDDRRLYHVALLGDIPVGVDGRPSTPLEGPPGEPYVP